MCIRDRYMGHNNQTHTKSNLSNTKAMRSPINTSMLLLLLAALYIVPSLACLEGGKTSPVCALFKTTKDVQNADIIRLWIQLEANYTDFIQTADKLTQVRDAVAKVTTVQPDRALILNVTKPSTIVKMAIAVDKNSTEKVRADIESGVLTLANTSTLAGFRIIEVNASYIVSISRKPAAPAAKEEPKKEEPKKEEPKKEETKKDETKKEEPKKDEPALVNAPRKKRPFQTKEIPTPPPEYEDGKGWLWVILGLFAVNLTILIFSFIDDRNQNHKSPKVAPKPPTTIELRSQQSYMNLLLDTLHIC
eukprot:TRINITY_DN7704_c0_g2_i2.p1 TRINITY_DN7704_c0_g2~~TRINITY_DN7704_c0_g2_i2.p1  ORF type:complete len:305 (+),score=80.40 TRINITY_DN7704_c0_g2_i2:65-979(+)